MDDGKLWKDWTPEDWTNAVFCEDCGLPLLTVEDEPDVGHYLCVYCTWHEDEEAITNGLHARIDTLMAAVKAEFDFYTWYMNAPSEDIVRNVERRRKEVQELCRKALGNHAQL